MLEYEKTYPLIRVYFNSRAAFPYCFSIDDGDSHNELIVTDVTTQGIGKFVYNGQEPNPHHPVAWLEFRGARVHKIDESEEIFVENSSEY